MDKRKLEEGCCSTPESLELTKIFSNDSRVSKIKSLNFLEKIQNMKENCAIKAFNHVNKTTKNSLIDEPEVVNFIIDSIRKCSKEPS